jgi:lipopolysaccharide transport system ATP-binding protein
MCSDVAIGVRNLGKCYQIYEKPHHRLKQSLWRGRRQYFREFWALRDVSFDIMKGDTVGIIGRNGSGKSTLLQLIAGILSPTEGEVTVNGRVTALLELGAGFNAEFTGLENVYMSGAILGLSRREVDERLQAIIDFSEIEQFIEQPVKTYSSGMFVRLAFAVAANLDPDILIVDEALSVGDVRFQRKCFRKFEELQTSGTTILFVTHSTELIVNHCHNALLVDEGGLREIGEPRQVVHTYLDRLFGGGEREEALVAEPTGAAEAAEAAPGRQDAVLNDNPNVDGCQRRRSYNPEEYRWGDQRARIIDYLVTTSQSVDPVTCSSDENVTVELKVHFLERLTNVVYGITFKTVDGVTVYGTNTVRKKLPGLVGEQGDSTVIRFSFVPRLLSGDYFISVGVAVEDELGVSQAVDRRYDMIHLHIDGNRDAFGIADLAVDLTQASQ